MSPRTHLGPRASLTWAGPAGLTVHGGYARYAVAAPLGEAIIAGTSQATGETDDYADLGAQRKLGDLTLGVDAYWRRAHHFLADRQWPIAPVTQPFNYRRATLRGVELLATYADGPMTVWANLALAQATARGIATNAALFSPAQVAFVDSHDVSIDLDQRATATAGLSYRFGPLLLSGDVAYGAGHRQRSIRDCCGAGAANTCHRWARHGQVLRHEASGRETA